MLYMFSEVPIKQPRPVNVHTQLQTVTGIDADPFRRKRIMSFGTIGEFHRFLSANPATTYTQ
jgi:hypothetical protein